MVIVCVYHFENEYTKLTATTYTLYNPYRFYVRQVLPLHELSSRKRQTIYAFLHNLLKKVSLWCTIWSIQSMVRSEKWYSPEKMIDESVFGWKSIFNTFISISESLVKIALLNITFMLQFSASSGCGRRWLSRFLLLLLFLFSSLKKHSAFLLLK